MTVLLGGQKQKNIRLGVRKNEKVEKVTSSQDDEFVGVSTENILNKLALMGRSPGHPQSFLQVQRTQD
jgi:hypothetical protein